MKRAAQGAGSVRRYGEVGVEAKVVSLFRPRWKHCDWSQEELAELYRIEHVLIDARLAVDTDRGMTDEGDPWFVFCRHDGEVLVHISRVRNEYFLHSPGLQHPLVGRSFHALTKSFLGQLPLHLPLQSGRGAQLYVHPSAMLTVIIGTIFFASQDIKIVSHTEEHAALDRTDHASLVHRVSPVLHAAFQAYMELFVDNLRDWTFSREPAYLTLIGAVVAFALGSSTVLEPEFLHDAAVSSLVADVDGSSAHPSGEFTPAPDAAMGNGSATPEFASARSGALTDFHSLEANKLIPDAADAIEEVANAKTVPTEDANLALHKSLVFVGNDGYDGSNPGAFTAVSVAVSHQFVTGTLPDNLQSVGTPSASETPATLHFVEDVVKSDGLMAMFQTELAVSHDAFAAFVDALKVSFVPVTVPADTPALQNIALNVEHLTFGDHTSDHPTLAPAPDATAVQTPATSGITALPSADAAAPDTPIFDLAAASTINAFLHANPNSEVMIEQGIVIIFDGRTDLHSALSVQVWESSSHASAIAIVGHVDHGLSA